MVLYDKLSSPANGTKVVQLSPLQLLVFYNIYLKDWIRDGQLKLLDILEEAIKGTAPRNQEILRLKAVFQEMFDLQNVKVKEAKLVKDGPASSIF